MSLGSIPTELVEMILEHVLPDDLEAFVLTCSDLHQIAIDRLEEHRDLKKKYSSIDMSFKGAGKPLDLMLKLCSHPTALYYPKHVKFTDGVSDVSEMGFQKHVNKIVARTDLISYDETMTCFRESGGLTQDKILAMSLCLFPNLSSIYFEPVGRPFPETTGMIERIMAAETDSYHARYLSKLSEVAVARNTLFQDWDDTWFAQFMTIPSLRTFQCDGCTSADIRTEKASQVTNLVLTNAQLSSEACATLIGYVKALESFTYTQRRSNQELQVHRLLEILGQNAAESLQALEFEIKCEKCSGVLVKAIRGFPNIKTIALNAQVLAQEDGECLDLEAILPLTIEEVRLTATLEFACLVHRHHKNARGPIGSLKVFSNLRKVTLDIRLLIMESGNLLDLANVLPPSIEEFTIISPPPRSLHTRWEEQEQLLSRLQALGTSSSELVNHITVRFDVRDYPKYPFPRCYEEVWSRDTPSMRKDVSNRFAVLKAEGTATMNITVTIKYGKTE